MGQRVLRYSSKTFAGTMATEDSTTGMQCCVLIYMGTLLTSHNSTVLHFTMKKGFWHSKRKLCQYDQMGSSLFRMARGTSSSSLSRCSLQRRLVSSPVSKKPPLPLLLVLPVSSCREVPSACALSSAKALHGMGAL